MSKSAVDHMDVRWRVKGTQQWSAPRAYKPAAEVAVDGLERDKQYEFQARNVSACGAMSVWVSSDYTVPPAPVDTLTLVGLQQNIQDASSSAAAANIELAAIASDDVLSPAEKPNVVRDYSVIIDEQLGIDSQANAYGVVAEKTTYDSAIGALTAYLETLTLPTVWNDKSGNTTIDGATFKAAFTSVYTARQALLNAIYAAAKGLADNAKSAAVVAQGGADDARIIANNAQTNAGNAQTTANTATSLASQVAVVNPGFDAGDTGWTKEPGWTIQSNGSFGYGPGYAQKSGGAASAALRNVAVCFVQPGHSYKVQALIKAIGANGQCYARISWRDLNDAEIGTANGNFVTGTTVAGSFATGIAPAGAVFAHAEIAATSHTAGTYQVDNVISTLQPATADEISESGGRKWAGESGADVTGGKPLSSLSGRTMDYIGDSASRVAMVPGERTKLGGVAAGADVTAANPQGSGWLTDTANLARGGDSIVRFGGRTLDNIGDSAGRFAAVEAGADRTSIHAPIGDNLLVNPGFEANHTGPGDGYLISAAGPVCDGWWAYAPTSNIQIYWYHGASRTGGGFGLLIRGAQGAQLPNDAFYGGTVYGQTVPVNPGDVISVGGYIYGNKTVGGSTTFLQRLGVQFLDGNGDVMPPNNFVVDSGVGGWREAGPFSFVAPAGAVGVRYICGCYFHSATTVNFPDEFTAGNFDDLWMTRNDVRAAGSGVTVGDQRNLNPLTWAGVRSVLSSSPISYSISGTTINVSVAAVTFQGGGPPVSFSASSGSVAQAAGTTVNYWCYYRDSGPNYGGSKSLYITSNVQSLATYSDIWILGSFTATVASGGGGTGGTGGGGGGYCVADDMFVGVRRRAGDADIGDPFDCLDIPTQAGKHVRALQGLTRGVEECVRMITADGCALVCSVSTPFDLPDGRNATALHMLGEQVITDLGTATVISLALVGPRPVTRAHLGGVSYAAGADPHRRIYSHNAGAGGVSKP